MNNNATFVRVTTLLCLIFSGGVYAQQSNKKEEKAPISDTVLVVNDIDKASAKKKRGILSQVQKKVSLYPFKPIKIGNQIWSDKNISIEIEGSKCYDNNELNCQQHGRLYTWEMAKKIAAMYPEWRLPTKQDYEDLFAVTRGMNEAKKLLGGSLSEEEGGIEYPDILTREGSQNVLLVNLQMSVIQAKIELQKAIKALEKLRYGDVGDDVYGAADNKRELDLKTSLKLALVNYRLLQLKGATKEELALSKKDVLDIKLLIAEDGFQKSKEVGEKFAIAEARVALAEARYNKIELEFVLAQINLGLPVEHRYVILSDEELGYGGDDKNKIEKKVISSITLDDMALLNSKYSPFAPDLAGCFDDYEYTYYYLGANGYLWTNSLSEEGKPYAVFISLATKDMKLVDYFRASRYHSVRLIKKRENSLLDKK